MLALLGSRPREAILFRFSPDDYTELGQIWNGPHPEDGKPLEVKDAIPEGAVPPELPAEPQLSSPLGPDIDPALFGDIASRLFGDAVLPGSKSRRSS